MEKLSWIPWVPLAWGMTGWMAAVVIDGGGRVDSAVAYVVWFAIWIGGSLAYAKRRQG